MAGRDGRLARGRPRRGPRRLLRMSFTLDPDHAPWLRAAASRQGSSMSQVVDAVLAAAREPSGSSGPSRARISVPEEAVAALCRRHRIRRMSLFGSVLTPRFGPRSDIDVLVEFEPGATPGLFGLAAVEEDCAKAFGGRKVDLRLPGDLGRFIRKAVLRQAVVIHG